MFIGVESHGVLHKTWPDAASNSEVLKAAKGRNLRKRKKKKQQQKKAKKKKRKNKKKKKKKKKKTGALTKSELSECF